jgi:predicted phosphodiesterase
MKNKVNNKIIVLGDTHGLDKWKEIVKQPFSKVIFLGDYFDSFDVLFQDQWENFTDILEFKSQNPDKVILLLGNHEYHYLGATNEHYSGYQFENSSQIGACLDSEIEEGNIQICYVHYDFIFSHAGITNTWYNENVPIKVNIRDDINNLFKTNPEKFKFTPSTPLDNSGDSITQSPLWVRPRALLSDKIDGFTQVVGHTHKESIEINEDVIFMDTLEYGNEYLIINKDIPEVGVVRVIE